MLNNPIEFTVLPVTNLQLWTEFSELYGDVDLMLFVFMTLFFFLSCASKGGAVYAISGEDTLLGGISSFQGNTAVSLRARRARNDHNKAGEKDERSLTLFSGRDEEAWRALPSR